MKKLATILFVFIAFIVKSNAQIPNAGFENWITVGAYQNPTSWGTANPFSTGSFYAVTRSTDHYPANVGSFSARIENNISLLTNKSGLGLMMTGILTSPIPAFAITGHPNSLTGYYKFAPLNGDSLTIYINLFSNGVRVSGGQFQTTVAASAWTSFTIPISTYTTADSCQIACAAYQPGPVGIPYGNSVLYVDNLNFDNLISSVSEQTDNNTGFNLYPNPASDILTITNNMTKHENIELNIYTLMGVLVRSEMLSQNQQQINIADLRDGVYLVTIKSNDFIQNQRILIQQ